MYEIDSKKRYNVIQVYGKGWERSLENVQLKVVERDFIVVIDENNKEHIFTGTVGLHLTEI